MIWLTEDQLKKQLTHNLHFVHARVTVLHHKLTSIEAKLDQLLANTHQIQSTEIQMSAATKKQFDSLIESVTRNTSLEGSMLEAYNAMQQMKQQAEADRDGGVDADAVDSLTKLLDERSDALQRAITANIGLVPGGPTGSFAAPPGINAPVAPAQPTASPVLADGGIARAGQNTVPPGAAPDTPSDPLHDNIVRTTGVGQLSTGGEGSTGLMDPTSRLNTSKPMAPLPLGTNDTILPVTDHNPPTNPNPPEGSQIAHADAKLDGITTDQLAAAVAPVAAPEPAMAPADPVPAPSLADAASKPSSTAPSSAPTPSTSVGSPTPPADGTTAASNDTSNNTSTTKPGDPSMSGRP